MFAATSVVQVTVAIWVLTPEVAFAVMVGKVRSAVIVAVELEPEPPPISLQLTYRECEPSVGEETLKVDDSPLVTEEVVALLPLSSIKLHEKFE